MKILALAFFFPFFVSSINTTQGFEGYRTSLTRPNETIDYVRDAQRSFYRYALLSGNTNNSSRISQSTLKMGLIGEYIMKLSIGTPAVSFWAVADTGSDLIWTQCKPCVKCFKQPTAIFDPAKSSSFFNQPCTSTLCHALSSDELTTCTKTTCGYYYSYASREYSEGYLATETFKLGNVSTPKIGFGCGTSNEFHSNSSGLVGLGRGNLSLVKQLGFGQFSYCLTSDRTKSSPILFGSLATLNRSKVQSTPLIQNPFYSSFYYINLVGITVGSTWLPIFTGMFSLNSVTGVGGLVIDSGTALTILRQSGYDLLAREFISQMSYYKAIDGTNYGYDLCFIAPMNATIHIPQLILEFDGGATMAPPQNNYFVLVDKKEGVFCLLIVPSRGFSILGNYMQMNMHILYDLKESKLSFRQTDCTKV